MGGNATPYISSKNIPMRIKCDRTGTAISLHINAPTGIELQESGAIEEAISDIQVANRGISSDVGSCMWHELDVSSDDRTGEVGFVEYTERPHRNTRRPTSESEGTDRSS